MEEIFLIQRKELEVLKEEIEKKDFELKKLLLLEREVERLREESEFKRESEKAEKDWKEEV